MVEITFTDEQHRLPPFTYMAQRVRTEIAEARAAGIAAAPVADEPHVLGAARLGDLRYRQLVGSLTHPVWSQRTGALLTLCRGAPPRRAREWISNAFRLALDDPDARVRGTAWLVIAEKARDPQFEETLAKLTLDAFVDRFGVRAELAPQLGFAGRFWLDELREEVGRAACKRQDAESQKQHMRHLAGSDGELMHALGPHGAAAFLDHANAGHRLAALLVLSRAGVPRAEHVERVCEQIRKLPREHLARFVHDPAQRQRLKALAAAPSDPALVDDCAGRVIELICADPEARVRCAAVGALGALFARSGSQEIERFLAHIVLDAARADDIRYAACNALSTVHGHPFSESPLGRALRRGEDYFVKVANLLESEPITDFDWGMDVDWDFVRACARHCRDAFSG